MGTSKPLTILVIGTEIADILALEKKGHVIVQDEDDLSKYDLILGPNCARFLPGMEQFLDSFIKGGRSAKGCLLCDSRQTGK